jgi:hypothetical protein
MVRLVTFSCGYPVGSFRPPRKIYRPSYRQSSDTGKMDLYPQIAYVYGDGIEDGFYVSRQPVLNVDCVLVTKTNETAYSWKFETSIWSDSFNIILWGYASFNPSSEVVFI